MKLYIKNMVCSRCETIVKAELEKIGVEFLGVKIGEVETKKIISGLERQQFAAALHQNGFELIDDQKNVIIEKLKKAVLDLENFSDEDLKTGFAEYISLIADDNFISLNQLFAEIEGMSIEKYVVKRKIDQIKELLVYEEFNIDEIARKMHYSSTAALTRQFKLQTGLTPAHFKQLRLARTSIPELN